MSNDSGFRLDSSSKDESVRLITILPEKIAESQQSNLRRLFHGILAEIDETSANIILVKTFFIIEYTVVVFQTILLL
jgi:hypothetical protein